MTAPDKTAPPAASPEPEDNAGYAETRPRDREDALRNPRPKPNPDDGGLDREPEVDPDPAGHEPE